MPPSISVPGNIEVQILLLIMLVDDVGQMIPRVDTPAESWLAGIMWIRRVKAGTYKLVI